MRANGSSKAKLVIIALTLVLAMGVAGISAYFTDAETVTNTFVVGDVSLDLEEPSWDPDPEDPVVPNEEVEKDPQIKNNGTNDMYVFLKVEMPYAEVITANADGTKNAAAWMELFTYEINDGWVAMGAPVADKVNGMYTQIYAYAADDEMIALSKDVTTPALFDSVKLQNIVEGQNIEGSTENIVITAYGIQTDNINGGKTDPAGVWEVVLNQAAAN